MRSCLNSRRHALRLCLERDPQNVKVADSNPYCARCPSSEAPKHRKQLAVQLKSGAGRQPVALESLQESRRAPLQLAIPLAVRLDVRPRRVFSVRAMAGRVSGLAQATLRMGKAFVELGELEDACTVLGPVRASPPAC